MGCSRMVCDKRSNSVIESEFTSHEGPIKRVKAMPIQPGRVADIMKPSGFLENFAVIFW